MPKEALVSLKGHPYEVQYMSYASIVSCFWETWLPTPLESTNIVVNIVCHNGTHVFAN